MRICICDDSLNDIEQLTQVIYAQYQSTTIQLAIYHSTKTLLFEYQANPNLHDLIIMDQMYADTDGIKAANQLRQDGYHGDFIFLTTHKDNCLECFECKPLAYILKQTNYATKLKQALATSYTNTTKRHKESIIITNNGETHWIFKSDIIYIESEGRKINIVTDQNETFTCYKTMDQTLKHLEEPNFLRVHKSFIINTNYIKAIHNNNIQMANKHEVPIGRSYLKPMHALLKKAIQSTYVL